MQLFANSHPTQENAGAYYDGIDTNCYDDFLVKVNFTDPYHLIKAIASPAPAEAAGSGEPVDYGLLNMPRESVIFDMGQGTGIMGKLAAAEGFTTIDAADASQNFVDTASASGWYRNCTLIWFGKGVEALPPALIGVYDVVMASGVFLDGHIPASGFEDAHTMLKTGGYFVTSMRRSYYELGVEQAYREKLDEMQAAGKFQIVKTWEFMRGIKGAEDPMFAEMPSFMFVAKRLD